VLGATEAASKNSAFSHIIASALLVFTVSGQYLLTHTAQQFADVFKGFGAKLPFWTQVFLPDSPIYFLFPTICFLAYIGHWLRVQSTMGILIVCAVATAVMYPIVLLAMYLPIFQLNGLVGK